MTAAIGNQEHAFTRVRDGSAQKMQAARQFEELFASMMIRSMRNTVPQNGFLPQNMGEKIYTSMLDDEMAKLMARHSTMGLSKAILQQLGDDENQLKLLTSLPGSELKHFMLDNKLIPKASQRRQEIQSAGMSQWRSIINEASDQLKVDKNLISAVIQQESAGDPLAVSHAGAKGLMQLMDTTAREMGVRRIFNPRDNIFGGTRYLRTMLDRFNGDIELALAAYNAGPGAVDKYKGIPPYSETKQYVRRVMDLQRTMQQSDNTLRQKQGR